jgi:hypothetical protein
MVQPASWCNPWIGIVPGTDRQVADNFEMKLKFITGVVLLMAVDSSPSVVCAASELLQIDHRALVSRADLHYTNAVKRSEEGMPVGNGRMGSLVWTTPSALRFQINRVDVFGNNSATESFPQRHTDYCGGCGFVDIDLSDSAASAFPNERTTQHLLCADGIAQVTGDGVAAQVLAWNEQDVMAVQMTDQRARPGAISINLRMLRPALVKTLKHSARSTLESRNGRIILTQEFSEGTYLCRSVVAVAVVGRKAEVRSAGGQELRLVTEGKAGAVTVLIASGATFSPEEDIVSSALAQLDAAAARTFSGLAESNRKWWNNFWSKSFIHLHSEDGVANFVERSYTYFLYLMASTSRGKFPTKFNGMLWTTGGDQRQWGGQFWGANQSCLYNNTAFAANHTELLNPLFDMYSGMLDSCALAAKQQWGSQGVWFPETVGFDGLASLPDEIAAEMRELYLLKKPWAERSRQFLDYASHRIPHSSRWNWIGGGQWVDEKWVITERGAGPFGPVTHIFSRGAKIAYQYWLRYEYTQDEAWLRERAYPVLKGVAEFYRNFPNVKKEADGRYHIDHVNSNESVQGARDTDEGIASMMGIFPVLIKASKILDVDADLRPVWQEFLANLAPLPRSDGPEAAPSQRGTNAPPIWIRGYPPVARGTTSGRPDGNTMPEWFFDLCTLESDDATFKIGNETLGTTGGRRVGVLSKIPLAAAIMGRADAVRTLVPMQFDTNERGDVMANRMDLREGPQTTSAQRLGNASDALHTALCYDLPAGPGQPPVIRVFAAWPEQWDAEFTLLARGGFLVTSAIRKGEIKFVELQSQLGGECRLRNPWDKRAVTLHRNGSQAEDVSGEMLKFQTGRNETIVVVPLGSKLSKAKIEL